MTTIMKISSRNLAVRRRSLMKGGLAGVLASGLAPTIAKAAPIKLVMAHLNALPDRVFVSVKCTPDGEAVIGCVIAEINLPVHFRV